MIKKFNNYNRLILVKKHFEKVNQELNLLALAEYNIKLKKESNVFASFGLSELEKKN